ncbi:hypothetical protein G6011_04266 [Alternaria panax]|uniref:Uncharacterized protein n=1 Tax=Alternaria panax TaxID=48097 RepID=A0AAD4IG70_9PLEO|nr:hypothetical protein G6011_04266 [Alternaria panax]
MSVNSELKAQRPTEADLSTLSYVHMLADSIFAPEHKASILVHPSYFNSDEYLATLIARSTTSQSAVIDAGQHQGNTREEALLGLLHHLEKTAAKKSQNSMMEFWEACYKSKIAKQEAQEQAARAAKTAHEKDTV